MRILLIGGSGLISTPITRFLLERGDDVVLYNRGQTPLQRRGAVRQIIGDRDDYPAFEAHIAGLGRFDCVIDMVCFTPAQAESAVAPVPAARRSSSFAVRWTSTRARRRVTHTVRIRREAISDYGRNKAACGDIFLAAHARSDFAATIIRPATDLRRRRRHRPHLWLEHNLSRPHAQGTSPSSCTGTGSHCG